MAPYIHHSLWQQDAPKVKLLLYNCQLLYTVTLFSLQIELAYTLTQNAVLKSNHYAFYVVVFICRLELVSVSCERFLSLLCRITDWHIKLEVRENLLL